MIKANELRIGNWLNSFWDVPFQVSAKDIVDLQNSFKFHPPHEIPLTPEILLACGFELFEYNYGRCTGYQRAWSKDLFRGFMAADNIFAILDYTARHFNIQYLHQLQNLYFSLTQEELTYKPMKL